MWKIAQNRLLVLVYNNSIFHTFETKNVENVESHDYQRLFKIENVEEMWKNRKARLDEYVAYYEGDDGIPQRQPPPSLFDPLPLKEDLYINVVDELLPRTQLFPDEPTESEPGSPVTTTPPSEEGAQPGSPFTTNQDDLLYMLSGQFPSQPQTTPVTWHVL